MNIYTNNIKLSYFTNNIIIFLIIASLSMSCVSTTPESKPTPDRIKIARDDLDHQIQYWTQTNDDYQYTARITYLSPQLIEAALKYKIAQDNLPPNRAVQLKDEVLLRLNQENHIPFILSLKSSITSKDYSLKPNIETGLYIISLDGLKKYPQKYDRIFDGEYGGDVLMQGYVFFPRITSSNNYVNLNTDASFTVRLDDLEMIYLPAKYNDRYDLVYFHENLGWSFNLVPLEFPLDRITQHEIPAERRLSASDVISIMDMAITIIAIFLPGPP